MPLVPPGDRRFPIEAPAVWLTIEEAAVLLGLLELLPEAGREPQVLALRERWQARLGARMSEAMTGLSPDGRDDDLLADDHDDDDDPGLSAGGRR